MNIGEYLKGKLEQDYLGKKIKSWNGSFEFIVSHISVENGGVDPQWEIALTSKLCQEMLVESGEWQRVNNPKGGVLPPSELTIRWNRGLMESYFINFCDNSMPHLVELPIPPIDEDDIELDKCEQCGEDAWDGYICHNCGLKHI